ncbi:hypothetical protein TNIN_208001 [Trichonephila inaurata madagascariensis]|uniref:Uncharacterized protein n=1 Tax=Trichonephila inaurata madagascariensis TaxID=2747483 RepID=A0A8X7BP24_9ARAC|nr:hypothetical protein TNIN_208001 [Trichonephila inaurata madagascariensis]
MSLAMSLMLSRSSWQFWQEARRDCSCRSRQDWNHYTWRYWQGGRMDCAIKDLGEIIFGVLVCDAGAKQAVIMVEDLVR